MNSADETRTTARDIARLSQERRDDAAALRSELYGELQHTFAYYLKEHFDRTPAQDPTLSALFLAIADQLAPVYEAAEEHLPAAVLDDLLRGLGASGRSAVPAQTVIQFIGQQMRERVSRSMQLLGSTRSGTDARFSPDFPIVISRTRLLFAAVLDAGEGQASSRLMTVSGPVLPSGAALDVAQARLPSGAGNPAMYFAFQAEEGEDLSGLGLFVDTTTPYSPTSRVLRRSSWQLLTDVRGHAGVSLPLGLLRVGHDDAPLSRLRWVQAPADNGPPENDELDQMPVFRGHYGPQVFLFPDVPLARRFSSSIPEYIESGVRELLPPTDKDALDQPCIWLRIPLPPNMTGIALGVRRVLPHCVTASNLEIWSSERVAYKEMGPSLNFLPESNPNRHIAGVLSVIGESGTPYVDATLLGRLQGGGTYRVRSPMIEFEPFESTLRTDSYARIRLVITDAEAANGLEPGRPFIVESALTQPSMQVVNLTESRDGRPPPDVLTARRDFASRLRTRERVVTREDIDVASRAFDARIISATTAPTLAEYAPGGTRLVVPVWLEVDQQSFEDPSTEIPVLAQQLEAHLHARAPIGTTFRVRPSGK